MTPNLILWEDLMLKDTIKHTTSHMTTLKLISNPVLLLTLLGMIDMKMEDKQQESNRVIGKQRQLLVKVYKHL